MSYGIDHQPRRRSYHHTRHILIVLGRLGHSFVYIPCPRVLPLYKEIKNFHDIYQTFDTTFSITINKGNYKKGHCRFGIYRFLVALGIFMACFQTDSSKNPIINSCRMICTTKLGVSESTKLFPNFGKSAWLILQCQWYVTEMSQNLCQDQKPRRWNSARRSSNWTKKFLTTGQLKDILINDRHSDVLWSP